MKKSVVLLISIFFISIPSFADGLNMEFGYTTVGGDEQDISIDLGAIYGILGYEWNHAGNYSSTVEGLVALGIQDDDVFGADIELEPSVEVAYRGIWQTSSPDFSLFWRASFARVEAEVSGGGFSESEDETGFGLGVGATWRGFTLGYTQYLGDLDDIDRINFGYRFSF